MQRFQNIKAWQKAHGLCLSIHRLVPTLPPDAHPSLGASLARSALAASTHIAAGAKRQRAADYAHELNLAEAALTETEAVLLLLRQLGHLGDDDALFLFADVTETARLLAGLRTTVQRSADVYASAGPLDDQRREPALPPSPGFAPAGRRRS